MRKPFTLEFFYAIFMREAGKPRRAGLCGVQPTRGRRRFHAVPTLRRNNRGKGRLKSVNQGKFRNKIFTDR